MNRLIAKPVAENIQKQIVLRTSQFIKKFQRSPKLVVVLVGNDPASVIYTSKKGELAIKMGMATETLHLPETATPNEVKTTIDRLNADPSVDGILIQRPLPKGFREEDVLYWVSPEKDVDAFHPINAGKLFLGLPSFQPCTPAGVMELLKYYQIDVAGKIACVIGRSSIVGKPIASLLLKADATVLHCHSKTARLREITTQADILIVAAGKMEMIDSTYVKDGAVVIDVGIHKNSEGKTVGDVQFEKVAQKAAAISPVPGGVGPMTITILLQNTITAAENRENQK